MKRTIILATAVAALLGSCKNNAEETAIAGTEKYAGTFRTRGAFRGEEQRLILFPPDTAATFVDELVSDVYSGKLQAYYPLLSDTAAERTIAVEDLEKLGYTADTIEKDGKKEVVENYFKPGDASFVSFEQKYFYDTAEHKIRTEVTKAVVSRDVKATDGTFLGTEPVFYIKLK